MKACMSNQSDAISYASVPHVIWMLWFQGWDKAPQLCAEMLETWRAYNPRWQIRCISRADLPALLGSFGARYEELRQAMNLGIKLGFTDQQMHMYGESLIPPASESDLLRLYLLVTYGGVWVDATNMCRRPLDDWLPAGAASGFFAFFGDRQSPEHKGVPHIISSFLVSAPGHVVTIGWLQRTIAHWSQPFNQRPDLAYLWVNKLFRQLVDSDEGDPQASEIFESMPKIACEHGKRGPMWFYSSPEALAQGARLFELMLAPPTEELKDAVENDRETPMWKLAFREQLRPDSAYWLMLRTTLRQASETQSDVQENGMQK